MKKILLAAMALACTAAFAGEGQGYNGSAVKQKQQQQTLVETVSQSQASNAGNSQVITVAPVTTNIASDLKDQGATAAAISSAAAIEIAKIQAGTVGSRDAATDRNAALDRDTATTIAAGHDQAARDVAGTTQTIKNTPSVSGPQLVTSNDTCMGSTSGSANVPGIGISFGTSWVDTNCKMLKNSRELWNMGMKGAAMALMCKDADNREALELTGFECPQTTKAKKDAEVAAASK